MPSSLRNKIYLIGNYIEEINGSQLPSIEQVLGHFLYLTSEKGLGIREAATLTVERVLEFWERAAIPTRLKCHCIKKVEKLYDSWKLLKTFRKRRYENNANQIKKEDTFVKELENLFDIAHQKALEMMENEIDKTFLLQQRQPGRKGKMGGADKVTQKECENRMVSNFKKLQREQNAIDRAEKAKSEMMKTYETATLEDSIEQMSSMSLENLDEEFLPRYPKRRKVENYLTNDVCSSLDRHIISDRRALMVVGTVAKAINHDRDQPLDGVALSRETLRRTRRKSRSHKANETQDNFNPHDFIVIHWEGKKMFDLKGNFKRERLSIVATGCNKSQFLNAPMLDSGTGEATANAVYNALKAWKLDKVVQAMCFDTTSSNTGNISGACIKLEQLLRRDLLHLACRHHVMELVAGAAFESVLGSSTGPAVKMFQNFRTQWHQIDQERYLTCASDNFVQMNVDWLRQETLEYLQNALHEKQPRDDYRELIELSIIFLDDKPPQDKVKFKAPGAMHNARWMSKAIYCLKIWMFRDQFNLTPEQCLGLRDLCIFFALIYAKAWTAAPRAAEAPSNDLQMIKMLEGFSSTNLAINEATVNKIKGHLWYLSEELVGLALFDDNVPNPTKEEMVFAMIRPPNRTERPPKRAKVDLSRLEMTTLADFTTNGSQKLFTNLRLPNDFLGEPVSTWNDNPQFQQAKEVINSLAVVNDHAERAVGDCQKFSGHLTQSEEQYQCLLTSVAEDRKKYPKASRQALLIDINNN